MSSIDRKYFDIPTQYAMLFGRLDTTEFESVCRAQEVLGDTFERLAESPHNKPLAKLYSSRNVEDI